MFGLAPVRCPTTFFREICRFTSSGALLTPGRSSFQTFRGSLQTEVLPLRLFTSSTQRRREDVPLQARDGSLTWTQLHTRSPASFGLFTFDGYHELVAPGTSLPCSKSNTLESVLDYIHGDTLRICYRQSLLHPHVNLAQLELRNIRRAKKEDTKVKVTLTVKQDLTGKCTACFKTEDKWTKSEASVAFDATLLYGQGNRNVVITM